jgi:hypothetical protein
MAVQGTSPNIQPMAMGHGISKTNLVVGNTLVGTLGRGQYLLTAEVAEADGGSPAYMENDFTVVVLAAPNSDNAYGTMTLVGSLSIPLFIPGNPTGAVTITVTSGAYRRISLTRNDG